jgi:glycosyltransferase involved in cell wall biosynthesis
LQAWAERRELALERAMLRRAGRVTVISEFLAEAARVSGRPDGEILLLPNGANLDTVAPRPAADCRRELGLPPEGPYLGYVANYHPDQELLLGALAEAARRRPGLRLLKTGPPFHAALAARLGVGERIVDLGFVAENQIPAVLGAADVLVLPLEQNASNRARVPFKFTDYLAAGRPVATCAVGEIGRWFAPDRPAIGAAAAPDPAALGGAIADLLAGDAPREAMGRAARALAEAEFAWPALAERLDAFIGEWLNPRRTS